MQLSKSVALSRDDCDHSRFWYVDADLDHGGGNEYLHRAIAKASHHAFLVRGAHPAVHDLNPIVSQCTPFETLGGCSDGAHFFVRRVNPRQHVVGSITRGQLAMHDLLDPVQLCFIEDQRFHRRTLRRQFVKKRNIQIGKQAERQTSWYRRGGHHQQIRPRAQGLQFRAVEHAKAMLLVDDSQAQTLYPYPFLNDCLRAEYDGHGAAVKPAQERRAGATLDFAGQQRGRNPEVSAEALKTSVMLLRQQFGRSHHRDLVARFDHTDRSAEGNQRLTAAHIPKQHAVHLRGPFQVGGDFTDRASLRTGQSKRQAREQGARLPRAAFDSDSGPLPRAFSFQAQRQLEGEQLIERQGQVLPGTFRIQCAHVGVRGGLVQPGQGLRHGEKVMVHFLRNGRTNLLLHLTKRVPCDAGEDPLAHSGGKVVVGANRGRRARGENVDFGLDEFDISLWCLGYPTVSENAFTRGEFSPHVTGEIKPHHPDPAGTAA